MNERFTYNVFSRCIKDNQTGYIYSDLKEATKLLNEYDDNIQKKEEVLSKTLKANENLGKCLKDVDDILEKYNIHTLQKLDQVLMNEKTW